MSQSQVGVATKVNLAESEKHRPSSLELNDTKKSDLALRIVSPGLPALNEEMRSTIKLSQKIEQQQKTLIAARHSNSGSASNEGTNVAPANGVEAVVVNGESNTLPDEMDKMSTPTTIKRLKRDNIPTPLKMNFGLSASPMIHSAPIRQNRGGPAAKTYPRRFVPYQIQVQHQYPHPYHQTKRRYRYMLPQPNAYGGQAGVPHGVRRVRMLPYTSSGRYFPFHHTRPMAPTVIPTQSATGYHKFPPATSTVTDVYHGDYTKAAPLQSQPLSAQREVFDVALEEGYPMDDDRMPVSEDEIKEMQEKYDNNVESVAIDDDDEQHAEFARNDTKDHVFGSINIMNESVFNFKIFKQNPASPDDVSGDKEELTREREKFLKICETSWDEFVNSRL